MSTIKVTNLRHASATANNIALDSSNNAVVAGTLGCTGDLTITSGNLVVSSGNGIDFSATSGTGSSELFDDYEEGTHNVAMTGTSGGSITFSSNTLTYTKVGKLVLINGTATVSSTTMAGSEIIVTLPFNVAATSDFNDCVLWFFDSSASTFTPVRAYAASTSSWKLRFSAASVASSDAFVFNFCYRTV